MSSYKIHRWDAVISGNSIHQRPMIYIKPDISFMEFIEENDFKVICEIEGTNMPYDNHKILGFVDKSCRVPNCRPNFFAQTNYYVVTLTSDWHGYPTEENMGVVKFYALSKGVSNTILEGMEVSDTRQTTGKNSVTKKGKKKKDSMTKKQVIGVVSFLGVILCIVVLLSVLMKK
jgi:hypothetical protein